MLFASRARTLSCTQLGFVLFVTAFLIRLTLMLLLKPHINPVGNEMQHIIHALATKGEFADPFIVPTGPTAHYTPLYPLLVAPIFRVLGETPLAILIQFTINLVFASMQYALLPWLARCSGLPPAAGFLGGLIGAVIPVNFLSEVKMSETLSGLLFIAMTALTCMAWRQGEFPVRQGLWHGVLWGLAWLANPLGVPLWGALVLAAVWHFRSHCQRVLRYAVLTGVAGALVLFPWGLRNQRVMGKFILLRSNLGLELSISNNDHAHASFDQNVAQGSPDRHPYGSVAEATQMRDLGEVEYHRRKMEDFKAWAREHPARFLLLTVQRVFYFWFPWTTRLGQSVILWAITLLTLVGLWQVRRVWPAGLIFFASLLVTPGVYYLVQSAVRYRYQIQWIFYLLTGVAVWGFLQPRLTSYAGSASSDQTDGSARRS